MVYFKRVIVKNLRTGEEMECPSRYPGVYIMKALEGDTIKIILDIAGADEDDAGLRIYAFGKRYSEALEGRSHIEKTFTAHVPGTISILVGHYYPTPEDVLHVDDQRDIEFRQAQKPLPILHLDIPDSWEPSCDRFPCSISFTGEVYDATGQHKYANCDITATIVDLETNEMSTVQTTTDAEGKFKITFNVKKPGKKKITVVAHTPDGNAEAETTINVTGVQNPKCVFVDKASEVYIVIKQTGEMFYPGTELTVLHGATLLCCGLIKNEGADGTCGMFVFDKNSGEYLDGVTKFLKSGDMWLASVELTPSPGDYVLEFHAVHLEDGKRVVDDKA